MASTQPQHLSNHRAFSPATSNSRESLAFLPVPPTLISQAEPAHDPASLAIQGSNNTYTAAPSAYTTAVDTTNWLPQDDFASQDLGFGDSAYSADVAAVPWQQQQQLAPNPEHFSHRNGYPVPLPPRSRNPSAPSIRVTTDYTYSAQPQDIYLPASASSNSSYQLQETPYQQPSSAHLSPQTPNFYMAATEQRLHTPPRSPLSPRDPALGEHSRKRSHSEMSGGVPPQQHQHSARGSRSGSVASLQPQQSGEEDFSPRSRTIKRSDAPTNADRKYICTVSEECVELTFDRKCEWR